MLVQHDFSPGFPLISLPPNLLEKVLTKFEWKTYFSLHKTCKAISEFTRTSRNIRVGVDRNCHLLWEQNKDGSFQLKAEYRWNFRNKHVDIEDLYGVRFRALALPREIEEEFDQFLDKLKKYRITSTKLSLIHTYSRFNLTKERCAALFRTQRPIYLTMNSLGSNRFEATFHSKELKEMVVAIDAVSAFWAARNLLVRLEKMVIYVNTERSLSSESFFNLILFILQFLSSTSLPNLRSFTLHVPWRRPVPSSNELLEKFRSFDPAAQMYPHYQQERKLFLKNLLDSNGQPSEFTMNDFNAKVQYGEKNT